MLQCNGTPILKKPKGDKRTYMHCDPNKTSLRGLNPKDQPIPKIFKSTFR